MGIGSFRDQGTFGVFKGDNTKQACSTCPEELHERARDVMDLIDRAERFTDIRQTPGLNLEALRGTENKYSVRVNLQYRVTFFWQDEKAEGVSIEKHYGE